MATRSYDFVVYGATSFVGRLLTSYLLERRKAGGNDLRWALAGRSQAKLEQLRTELGAQDLPLIIADATDQTALRRLCDQAAAVVSTVGPYSLYGSTLVGVCAESGTDYCDLSGEIPWIEQMLRAHETSAQKSGARIVHCCGFDSIPSDLGVFFLQQQARARFGEPCPRIKMRVKAMRGSFSGGTVASLLTVARMARADAQIRRVLANPYAICPEDGAPATRQPSVRFAEFDSDFERWTAPFVMSGINTRVVHRSNALLDHAYGGEFRYDEAVMTGRGWRGRAAAIAMAAGLGAFVGAAALAPARWLLEKTVLPKPGDGPSPEAQAKGFYDLRFRGTTADGRQVRVKVTGDRDPGYGSTAKLLGEAVLCLASAPARERCPGGFWTPATALGDRLLERLKTNAGMTFEVLD